MTLLRKIIEDLRKKQLERQQKMLSEIYEWRVKDTMEELGYTREEAILALELGW